MADPQFTDAPLPQFTDAPLAASTPPSSKGGLVLAGAGAAAPKVAGWAMELATNPDAWKTGKAVGEVVGGVSAGAGTLMSGNPAVMLSTPAAVAAGSWAGAKAGWRATNLAQRLATPVASALEKLAPYAQTLSTLGAAQGVNDLAQMAEPGRRDIGFLGLAPSSEAAATHTAPNPAHYTPSPVEQARWLRDHLTAYLRGK